MMERRINLSPWEEISITTEIEHHTLIQNATIIIENNGGYFYIKDDIEKIKDVSNMPTYIKEDWVNYNKKDLSISVLNSHISELQYKSLGTFNVNKEPEETIPLLKSLRRDLIIKGII